MTDAIRITDPADPRVVHFRAVRDGDLRGRDGLFCVESPRAVRRFLYALLAARAGAPSAPHVRLNSLLLTPATVDALGSLEARARLCTADGRTAPLFVADTAVMSRLAGYKMHMGALALGERPTSPTLDQLLTALETHHHLLVPTGVVHPDNMGAIFRNAGSFANAGVLLAEGSTDPLNRKAIRISAGRVFSVPWGQTSDLSGDLIRLRRDHGFAIVAAEDSDDAIELDELFARGHFAHAPRIAVILGAEGHGVRSQLRSQCDATSVIGMGDPRRVASPLIESTDRPSLNVAVASALFLHRLRSRSGHPSAER